MPKTVTGELVNPAFDYAQLTKEEKGKLIHFEGQLSRSRKKVAEEAFRHGEILYGVQQVLAKHKTGVFRSWLDAQGISKSSAQRAIAVFVGFRLPQSNDSCPNWDNLEVSAMYQLAKNDKAKTKALKLAEKGVKVTNSMAKTLISGANGKPGKPKPKKKEPDKCPACAGTKWEEDEFGLLCAKCHHPHGEPAGDVDADRVKIQRQKTVKTVEALTRAFDDLQLLLPKDEHKKAIDDCKRLLAVAKEWK